MINRLIDENILDQANFTDLVQYLEFDDQEANFIEYNKRFETPASKQDIKSFLEENPLCLYKERSTYNLIFKKKSQNPLKKPVSPENNDTELMDEVRKALCVAVTYMRSTNNLGIYLTNDPLITIAYLYRDSGFYRSGKEIGEEGSCYDQDRNGNCDYVMEGMVKKMESLFLKMDFNQLYLVYKEEVTKYHLKEFVSY